MLDGRGDDVAPGGEADLSLELERGKCAGRSGRLEVGVVEHDERVVPAELERDSLQQTARERSDPPPRRGRSRERDPRDVPISDDRLPDVRATEDHLEQAVW